MVFEEIFTLAGVAMALTIGAIIDHVSDRNQRFPRFLGLILVGFFISELSKGILFLQPFINPLRETEFVEFIAEFALSLVLFREGMELNLKSFRDSLHSVTILATLGIVITAVIFAAIIALLTPLGFFISLLIAGLLIPTDPAATFGMFKGGIRIKSKEENIIGNESALNDAIAIVLVTTVMIESVLHDSLTLSPQVIIDFVTSFFGAVLLGYLLSILFLYINKELDYFLQKNFLSFGLVTLTFSIALSFSTIGLLISPAIATLSAGIIFGNPRYFNFKQFPMHRINEFQESISEFGEMVAFVALGTLLTFANFGYALLLGILFAIVILGSRLFTIVGIIGKRAGLTRDESIFVSWAGMRGLATGVLGAIALLELESYFAQESTISADLFISSVMIALILSATIQTLTLKKVGKNTDSLILDDKESELLMERKILTTKLEYYREQYDNNELSLENYSLVTIPIRDHIDDINKELIYETQSRVDRASNLFDELFMLVSVIENIEKYVIDQFSSSKEENLPGYDKIEELYENRKNTIHRIENHLEIIQSNMDSKMFSTSGRRLISKMANKYHNKIIAIKERHDIDKLDRIIELLEPLMLDISGQTDKNVR